MSAENPAKACAAAASPLPSPGEADYEAICAAVLATERGRWFLSEYAHRNRQADTAELLAAIERIGARAGADSAAVPETPIIANTAERLRAELAEVAEVIARTRTELASATADPAASDFTLAAAAGPLDAAAVPLDILAAAEEIQELAWTMREQGFDSQFSDRLDRCAAICLAASRQERGLQRVRKIRHLMRHLQGRIETINAMLGTAAQAVATEAQTETQGRDDHPLQQGSALLLVTGAQTTDAPAQPAQIQPIAVADGEERDSPGAAKEQSAILIQASRDKVEMGEGGDSPASTDHAESVTADLPSMPVPRSATTLTIEGPKGSFSIMPARATEPPDPIPPPATPLEAESTAADIRAFALELAAETDGPPATPSPTAQPPAMPIVAETNDILPAAATASAGDDDIFREGEHLPLAAAPQLGDPPQRPVGEPPASPRPSTDIAEYLFADVMALSEEERLALFT
jgi:hypothetical protein